MNLAKHVLELIRDCLDEGIKYKQVRSTESSYSLEASSAEGDIILSVAFEPDASDKPHEVYDISIGNHSIFSWDDSGSTVSIDDAKNIVKNFFDSRKFNVEKFVKNSKVIDQLLKKRGNLAKSPYWIAGRSPLDNLVSHIAGSMYSIDTGYADFYAEVPPFAGEVVLKHLRDPKVLKALYSKLSRYGHIKDIPNIKLRLSDITDKALDKYISKYNLVDTSDYVSMFFDNVTVKSDLLTRLGRN